MEGYYCTVLHTEDGKIFALKLEGQIDSTERFIELLQFIEGKANYIEQHDLVLVLPIGFGIASVLSYETDLGKLLNTYPSVRLSIREDFPNLVDGRRNRLLEHLSTHYKLWLGNLGSGARTNLVAVMERCFDGLVLDERFTQGNRDKKGIFPIVVKEVSKYCNQLIVPGTNTGRYRPVRLSQIDQLM